MSKAAVRVLLTKHARGHAMTVFTVAKASLYFDGEQRPFESGGKTGAAEIVKLETSDFLAAEVSIQRFDSGEITIRLTEFLSTPPPKYAHLNRNGAMTVQVREDGNWVALLRALRPGGKEHPTLNFVSWDELTSLLGHEAKEWLIDLGFEIGTWADLNPSAGRFRDSLAVSIAADKANLLVLPWALTRVIALMKKLGQPQVVDLG